jgi:P-type conjugative transfer protein TrbJ
MRRPIVRRTLVVTVVAAAVLGAGTAQGQTAVVDHINLIQNIRTALQTAQLVQNTAQQLQMMETQLQYQIQNLKSINPASINGLLALLNQGLLTYSTLQGDLSSIGYTINTVNRNFNRLFPKTQSQWQSVRYSDFNSYYDNWNNEITTSSQAALRAQTAISSLDANNAAIQRILLAANGSSTGEIRQLQLANQQLALIHAELASLVQNLTTVGRVITDWAAASTGEQMMNRERARRRLENYTYRGPPSQTLNKLP